MEDIISKALDGTVLAVNRLPKIPLAVTEADAKALQKAIDANSNLKIEANILRLLLIEVCLNLGSDKALRIISETNMQALQSSNLNIEARLRICELINNTYDEFKIDMVKPHMIHFSQKIYQITDAYLKNRLEVVKAGFEVLKKNYHKAAFKYINASKDEVLSEPEKADLIERAIAVCLLAEKTHELHQLICQLYINPVAKKSPCYQLLTKLYSQQMICDQDIRPLKRILPPKFERLDSEGVSTLKSIIFKHNMLPITKNFQSISLSTLGELLEMDEQELLLYLERSFTQKELQVDQVKGYLYVQGDATSEQHLTKSLFDSIDDLLHA